MKRRKDSSFRLLHLTKKNPRSNLRGLAPQVGLEPTTLRLTAECSAIELLRNMVD